MKKIIFLFSILLIFQSCNINTEVFYYADKTATLSAGFDFEELITQMEAMKESDSTSTKKDNKMGALDSLPTTWTSVYDMNLNGEKQKLTHPDSIRLAKKILIKRNVRNGKNVGFAFKFNKFTEKEFEAMSNKNSKSPQNNIAQQSYIGKWDGKKLVIDTKNLNFDALTKSNKNEQENKKDTNSEDQPFEKASDFLDMIKMNYTQTIKFENEIKSIKGKHDWVKQVDPHTLEIKYSTNTIKEEKPLKNKDKKIIVRTK